MSINAEVTKSGNESTLSTIRKFSRRVQGTGLVRTVRAQRYHLRSASKIVKKKRALKLIKRRAEFKQLVKEGKVSDTPVRGHGRPSFNRQNETQTQKPAEGASTTSTPIAR